MRNNLPILNVYKEKSIKSEVVTQLLFGDTFKKIKQTKSWVKIKNNSDSYKGYVKSKNFPKEHNNTHKIFSLSSNLYLKPNFQKPIL